MARDRSSPRHRARAARRRANLQPGFLVRVFALACVAVIGSVWALIRFYTHTRPPMVVPAPRPKRGAWDAGPGLIPAPEIEIETR